MAGPVDPTGAPPHVVSGWWYPGGMSHSALRAIQNGEKPPYPTECAWLRDARVWVGPSPQARTEDTFTCDGYWYPAGMLIQSKRDILEGRSPENLADREWLLRTSYPVPPDIPTFVYSGHLYPPGVSRQTYDEIHRGIRPTDDAERGWLLSNRVACPDVPDGPADTRPVLTALLALKGGAKGGGKGGCAAEVGAKGSKGQALPTARPAVAGKGTAAAPARDDPPACHPADRLRFVPGQAFVPREYDNKPGLQHVLDIEPALAAERALEWLRRLPRIVKLADLDAGRVKDLARCDERDVLCELTVRLGHVVLKYDDDVEGRAERRPRVIHTILYAAHQREYVHYLLGCLLAYDPAAPDAPPQVLDDAHLALRVLVGMQEAVVARGLPVSKARHASPAAVLQHEERYAGVEGKGDVFAALFQRARGLLDAEGVPVADEGVIDYMDVDVANFDNILDGPPVVADAVVDRALPSLAWHFNTQFYLLREDFARPLREGLKSLGGPQRPRDIWFNHAVVVSGLGTARNGLVYQMRAPLPRRRFGMHNRLRAGSLVALSDRRFVAGSILWGVVANSREIAAEYFDFQVRLEGVGPEIVGNTYDMVEARVYYEAYRHVLRVLQLKDVDALPFHGVLTADRATLLDIAPPATLRGHAIVLNSLLTHPELVDEPVLWNVDANGNRAAFPTNYDIILDETQLTCVQDALTREVCVIQGPPGTGKSFVGSRLCRVVLDTLWGRKRDTTRVRVVGDGENRAVRWNVRGLLERRPVFDRDDYYYSDDDDDDDDDDVAADPPPVFVLCFTNHALDAVLKPLLEDCVEDRVIRIGGRCSDPAVEPYALDNVLKGVGRNRHGHDLYEVKTRVKKLGEQLDVKNIVNKARVPARGRAFFEGLRSEYKKQVDAAKAKYVQLERKLERTRLFEEREQIKEEMKQCRHDKRTAEQGRDNTIGVWLSGGTVDDDMVSDDDDDGAERGWYGAARIVVADGAVAVNEGEDELANVDYANLPLRARQRLFDAWTAHVREPLRDEYIANCLKFERVNRRWLDEKWNMASELLRTARVVGATTTGCAKYSDIVERIAPQVVIVEEAAEVLESHILAALSPQTKHLILIGDHMQLQPKVNEIEMQKKGLAVSVMERLVRSGMQPSQLLTQRRMVEPICRLTSGFYTRRIETHECTARHPTRVRGMQSPLFFVDHKEEEVTHDGESPGNPHEAAFAVELAGHLLRQGYSAGQITILVPYRGQMRLVRDRQQKHDDRGLRDVLATTIDNYQGEECDIVILTLVRSKGHGFLKQQNRLIVALSRARWGMYVIGNMDFIKKASPEWRHVYDHAVRSGIIGDALTLECNRHDLRVNARRPRDFSAVSPRGGCKQTCKARLECGHTCEEMCHGFNADHAASTCVRPCRRVGAGCVPPRACQHACPKSCRDECGPCGVEVEKELPCGHLQGVPCSMAPNDAVCKSSCTKVLPCGHTCEQRCSQPCRCTAKVERRLPCGHTAQIRCGAPIEDHECRELCSFVLACEHRCSRRCGDCNKRGTLSIHECRMDCSRTLVCGHACRSQCTKMCPPCAEERCMVACAHSWCDKKCGDVCMQCVEPCDWECEHHRCDRLCWEVCERPRCDERCTKLLACGHRCRGVCGDPCPEYCMAGECTTGKDRLQDLLMVGDIGEDDLLVQLGCGHIFCMDDFDPYVSAENSKDRVGWLTCPTCRRAIMPKDCGRYRAAVNSKVHDVNRAKEMIAGREQQFRETRDNLLREIDQLILPPVNQGINPMPWHHDRLFTTSVYNVRARLKAATVDTFAAVQKQADLLKYYQTFMRRPLATPWGTQRMLDLVHGATTRTVSREEMLSVLDRAKVIYLRSGVDFLQNKGRIPSPEYEDFIRRVGALKDEGNAAGVMDALQEELSKIAEGLGAPLSREELRGVSKAIGFGAGHFFKCPNGHLYVIAHCGGAVEEAVCPDCKAAIGGRNHMLREDNAFAGDLLQDDARENYPNGWYPDL